jgi:hypothetical protein
LRSGALHGRSRDLGIAGSKGRPEQPPRVAQVYRDGYTARDVSTNCGKYIPAVAAKIRDEFARLYPVRTAIGP